MKVAVGSVNPVKIAAVRQAFKQVWPDQIWQVKGYPVRSGVPHQPMSDLVSIKGAATRARSALAYPADYGVGCEGGLQQIGSAWFDCGWIVVIDRAGRTGIGSSARIIVPDSMMQLIRQGLELGEVTDRLFKTQNAKQSDGHFGLMTNRHLTRTSGYKDGVIMALARFLQPWLFNGDH